MDVWDVLGKRSAADQFTVVGGIKAPDVDMALLLARETHFRHKEGVVYAVRRRGDQEVHTGPYEGEALGGLTDRAYRRQEGYVGVGAKLKRIRDEMARRGLVIDRPRPAPGRAPATDRVRRPGGQDPEAGRVRDISPEDLAAQGTAG
jgi:1,2-phenylacetyl-CoA epoxidase PaaB subunit